MKWHLPFIIALLGIVAIFAAACFGDDNDNPPPMATQQSTHLTLDDPRIKDLIQNARAGEFKNSSELQVAAYEKGFTTEEVDQIISLISVQPGVNALSTEEPGKDGGATETATSSPTATQPAATQTQAPNNGGSATEKRVLTSKGTLPTLPNDISHGAWAITVNDTALDPTQDGMVGEWLKVIEDPNPSQWKYFPNVGNPDRSDLPSSVEMPAPWGAEYGEDESPFCENHPCDIVVSARHHRLITGDYAFQGTSCYGDMNKGCALLLYNVMDQTVIFRDQDVDNGFTVAGRYWDGNELEWATLGLVSHASANMLGMETFAVAGEHLNFGEGTNAGANCGKPEACKSVDFTVLVFAGDRLLATMHTIVTPQSGQKQ